MNTEDLVQQVPSADACKAERERLTLKRSKGWVELFAEDKRRSVRLGGLLSCARHS